MRKRARGFTTGRRSAADRIPGALAETNLIVLHLGNGASATAVEHGRSIETSMGLTSLEGLVMGTRSGDIDRALPAYLNRTRGLTLEEIDRDLNRRAGMAGLAGDRDLRAVHRRADQGSADARLALGVYCHRIKKYVGAYSAVLGRVDAVVFTAGVGENDHRVRSRSLEGLQRLGIVIDPARNERSETLISAVGSCEDPGHTHGRRAGDRGTDPCRHQVDCAILHVNRITF